MAQGSAKRDDPVGDDLAGGEQPPGGPGDEARDRRRRLVTWPTRDRRRRVLAWVVTVLAGLLVFAALVAPNDLTRYTPAAFVRIPVEGLVGVVLLLLLPDRPRRVVATIAGLLLGLLTIVKMVDMGFFTTLARPFDLVLDWILIGYAVDFLTGSIGRIGAIGAVIVAVVLVIAVLVLMTRSVLRLTRLAVRHRTATTRAVVALGAAWVVCAVLGAQLVAGAPVASSSAAGLIYDRAREVGDGLRDQQRFATEVSVDAFRDTPGDQLLTALRGKDVIVAFVESYGRSAIEDPGLAPQVDTVLDEGTRRLGAAGFAARSAFLNSPTAGGGSWLAHSTLLSGLWINNQQRYRNLVSTDRLTLNGAFRRAGWRTVGVMPGVTRAWPEGAFFDFDQIYDSRDLGYRGPLFPLSTSPDQYTLSAFERLEHAAPGHAPLMMEVPLTSSHAPWTPIPRQIDWADVGDGSVYRTMVSDGGQPDVLLRGSDQVRADYRRCVEYSLNNLVSYVETYGDDNLVLVFLGDHQPAPVVTGAGASRDVPITIVAHDHAVLDRISGWGWQDGLRPGPRSPVWPMDTFRDRFLTAFGPHPGPVASPSPPSPPR